MTDDTRTRERKIAALSITITRLLDQMVEELGDDVLATTPRHEIAEWIAGGIVDPVRAMTPWEIDALRAAIHETFPGCYDGRFESCPDIFHSPPVDLSEWWPPIDPRSLS